MNILDTIPWTIYYIQGSRSDGKGVSYLNKQFRQFLIIVIDKEFNLAFDENEQGRC